MSYGLLYTIPFATTKNRSCVVEIEKEGYEGEAVELIAAGTPFTVEIDNEDFLYTPSRFSTAKLNVVGKDYLQTLFSTQYRQHRVTLTVDGVVTWCGYIKPEVYTQDYTSETFELELECMSAMSVLEYIDYTIQGEDKEFVSLWNLMKRCVEASQGRYTAVNVPFVYGQTKEKYQAGENVLDKMMVSEQNFFDEDDKPMKLLEILEEICKLLGWTCTDWRGELWFVDMEFQGTYHKYDPTLTTKQDTTFNELIVQNIGFSGSDNSLDVIQGYNKVTIKCSNYPVEELIPEEDYDLLDVATIPEDSIYEDKQCHRMILIPDKWNLKQYNYENGNFIIITKEELIENKEKANEMLGALPAKISVFDLKENDSGEKVPSITSYNYDDCIQVRWKLDNNEESVGINGKNILDIKAPVAPYSDGALAVNFQIRVCERKDMAAIGVDSWYNHGYLLASIRIGEYYYGSNITTAVCTPDLNWVKRSEVEDEVMVYIEYGDTLSEDSEWLSCKDTKRLELPYDGLTGCIIPFDKVPVIGDFEFKIYGSSISAGGADPSIEEYGMIIKDLSVKFQEKDGENKSSDSDRIYENVLNETYINELDEIELKISSYNDDGACYSKIVIDDAYLTNNLYNAILDKQMRPENMLISRIISHYSTTRLKLTEVINETPSLTPVTRMSDNFLLGKKFINTGGSIDFRNEQFSFTMIEI